MTENVLVNSNIAERFIKCALRAQQKLKFSLLAAQIGYKWNRKTNNSRQQTEQRARKTLMHFIKNSKLLREWFLCFFSLEIYVLLYEAHLLKIKLVPGVVLEQVQ